MTREKKREEEEKGEKPLLFLTLLRFSERSGEE